MLERNGGQNKMATILNITNTDIELCKYRLKYIYVKLLLLDDNLTTIDEMQGECVDGNMNIDVSSESRRTANIILFSKDKTYNVGEYNKIWMNRRVKIQFCLSTSSDIMTWYNMGIFCFNSCSYTYTMDTRTISISCGDLTTLLDGTHGGVIDGPAFLIESGNDLKKAIEDIIDKHTSIKDYHIGTIGVYGCLQDKSISWKQNRMDYGSTQAIVDLQERDGVDYLYDSPYLDDYCITTCTSGDNLYAAESGEQIVSGVNIEDYIDMGEWHTVPYDLEFSCGTPIYEMITKMRDLYLGYESYFDKDGQFIVDLIPTCEHDPLLLDYYDMSSLVIDESFNTDFTTIKNATRIYGKSIETDRYADTSSVTFDTYQENGEVVGYVLNINLEKVTLVSNFKIGIQIPEIDISSLDTTLPLYIHINSYSSSYTSMGELVESYTPHTLICTTRENVINTIENTSKSETVYKPILLSFFQSGESYSFQYISNQNTFIYLGMYQVEAYIEDNIEDSPFSINKIGLRLQVLSGGEYDDITDVELCKERAEYENWKAGRLNDTITLNTVIIPFLEGNQKVRYLSLSDGSINQYIIKNISYSFLEGTCSITMSRFYDLYPFIICSSSVNE